MRLRSLALASKISGGAGGGSAKTEPITITTNGVYTPSENVDGFSEVVVNTVEVPSKLLNITGSLSDNLVSALIPYFGEHMRTYDITNCYQGFNEYTGEYIPFDINITDDISKLTRGSLLNMSYMFNSCDNLKSLPKINIPSSLLNNENFSSSYLSSSMFYGCCSLEEIPDDWIDATMPYCKNENVFESYFRYCRKLKRLPQWWYDIQYLTDVQARYYSLFYDCYCLKELFIPIARVQISMSYTVYDCHMADTIIFKTQGDGSPYEVNWNDANFNLTNYVGYLESYKSPLENYPEVRNAETYEQYKNQDYCTPSPEYARYNKLSAERTISTLPDASAYCASNGGTNTITFKNNQGSATDGGAINAENLAASIAEATAKGWTVAFSN